jgi:exodeoxyribonuclease V alpha subunit
VTITLDPSQQLAVDLITSAHFALITGAPGTGKTTILKLAVGQLEAAGRRVALAAPTGKAARRMAESTGRTACTIHRLLGYGPGGGFTVDRVDAHVVIIDESSMLDYELARELFRRCRGSALILIGDANQLPPIGPGRMFGDLVDSGTMPVARLTHVHRSVAGSWVARNAPKVLTGGPLELDACPGFEWLQVDDRDAIAPRVREFIAGLWCRGTAGAAPMVLGPVRRGVAGTEAGLARELDPLLNALTPLAAPDEPILARGDGLPLRAGTRIIQTRNDYAREVMNGEVGCIDLIEPGARGNVHVRFPEIYGDMPIVYTRAESASLDCAFALTVHKVQGSQFPHVIVVCHSTHTRMLNRSLLYTAITRAQTRVTIVGDATGLDRALGKNAAARDTTLVPRIAGTLEGGSDYASNG